MPFKFRWPFRWPGRKAAAEPPAPPLSAPEAGAPPAAAPLAAAARPLPEASAPAQPVARAPEPERPFVYTPEPGEGPDLGTELLGRLPQLSTPPTLGQLGGLPAMAQALPTVDRFIQHLPAAPVQRLLEGAWSEISQFTTTLPSLSTLGASPVETSRPAFPEQLDTSAANAGLTDVLPPLGSLPGQVSAISGQAPVLAPQPQSPAPPPVVQIIREPGPAAAASAGAPVPVLRAVTAPSSEPAAPAMRPGQPPAPAVVAPLLTPSAPAAPSGLAGMLQVIAVGCSRISPRRWPRRGARPRPTPCAALAATPRRSWCSVTARSRW